MSRMSIKTNSGNVESIFRTNTRKASINKMKNIVETERRLEDQLKLPKVKKRNQSMVKSYKSTASLFSYNDRDSNLNRSGDSTLVNTPEAIEEKEGHIKVQKQKICKLPKKPLILKQAIKA